MIAFISRCISAAMASVFIALAPVQALAPAPTAKPDTTVMVWVSRTGSKYHKDEDCSNMKNPAHIPLTEAEALGRDPCKKCY